MASAARKYVSRAGLKLEHALREFDLSVNGLTCADFGCNVGGFTDCLLRHGADRVYAIDTGYGTLAGRVLLARIDRDSAVSRAVRNPATFRPWSRCKSPGLTRNVRRNTVVFPRWSPLRRARISTYRQTGRRR